MSTDRWEERYATDDIPWDSGAPSAQLQRILADHPIPTTTAIEIGCGTGTNAVFLARQGFSVTAVDVSPTAIAAARARAERAGVEIRFVVADLLAPPPPLPPADLVFDRAVYHVLRREDVGATVRSLEAFTHPGSWLVTLTGNADDPAPEDAPGPPRIRALDLCSELEPSFRLLELRAYAWTATTGEHGRQPLGWSAVLRRRGTPG